MTVSDTDKPLFPQDDAVLNLLALSPKGATPADILAAIDRVPVRRGRTRRDGQVYYRAHTVSIHRIRKTFGRDAVRTVITNGETRYFIGELS